MVRLLPLTLTCFALTLDCFNPTMVRLLPSEATVVVTYLYGFNPTMVRLLRSRRRSRRKPPPQFQSHNGAIAAIDDPLAFKDQVCFNPTMVRLLPERQPTLCARCSVFQSHNGAIAACAGVAFFAFFAAVSIPQWCDCCLQAENQRHGVSRFNPTMVRLLHGNDYINRIRLRFNPTMVRLLQSKSEVMNNGDLQFQSHNGAIAAVRERLSLC